MNLKDITTNEQAEEKGRWFAFDGAEFLIASTGSTAYKNALQRKVRAVGTVKFKTDSGAAESTLLDVLAESVLLSWKGEVKDGEADLEPTLANRRHLLTFRVFRDWVVKQADDFANYLAEGEASDADDLKSRS